MRCPKCGSTNCQMTISNNTKVHTSHRGYGCLSGCCGWVLMGPVGLLCGLCGAGKSHSWTETTQDEFWVCQECGTRFTAKQAENTTIVPAKFYCDNTGDFAEFQENPLIKKFMKGYAEKWSMSLLGNDLLTRKNSNETFETHKNSCDADWFENVPIIFAVEDWTSLIITTQDIIVGSVKLTLNLIKNIAVYDQTVYISSYCARFSNAEKAELFYELLQELFEGMGISFTKFDKYTDLLTYLQDLPKSELTGQSVHFSSQAEYATFVKELTDQALDKLKEERPTHFNNYVQAQEDKDSLQTPALIAFIIQVIAIFIIHLIYRGFLNAVLFTVLWGGALFIAFGIYFMILDSKFQKAAKEYLPSDLEKLIAENERNNLEKQGDILAVEQEKYAQLYGICELKDISNRSSIENKKVVLYLILFVLFAAITGSRLIKFNAPKTSSAAGRAVEATAGRRNTASERNETVAQPVADDSLGSYVQEGIRVKGEDLVNNPQAYYYRKIIIHTNVATAAPAGLAKYTDTLENFSQDDVAYLNRLPVWFSFDEFLGTYMMVYDDRYDISEKVGTADSFDTYGIFIGLNKDQLPIILARYIETADSNTAAANQTQPAARNETPPPTYAYTQAPVQDGEENACVIDGSNSRYLTEGELMGMSKAQLRLARNEIYARHGRIFKSDDLNAYFNSKDWYYPTVPADQFDESVLNQYEKQNLLTIKAVEESYSQTPAQGGQGYGYVIDGSDSRYLTKEELMGMSKAQLRLARNEIYARHGRIFKSDDLNAYFNSQDWYYPTVPADQFDESVLNQYEKQNLLTIKAVEESKTE